MIAVAIATVHCMICSTEEKLKRNRTILPTPLGTTLPLSHPHSPTITPSPSHYHTLTLPLSHPLLHSPTVADIKCPFTNCVTWRALVLDARNLTNHTLYSSLPQLHSASSIQYLNITAHTSTPVYMLLGYHQRTMVSVCVWYCYTVAIVTDIFWLTSISN